MGITGGKSSVEVTTQVKELEIKKDELAEEAKAIPKDFKKIEHIPVQIDLKRAHLGIVGSKANVHEQLKYLLAQMTFFQSYRDLQIIFIHNKDYDEEFEYVNWYPHLRIQVINVYGRISSEQARDQILGSIQQVLKERKMKMEEEKQDTVFSPYYLFIVDEPKLILNHAIMEYLQSKQLTLGFSMIYTTDQKANLPENVKTVCLLHNSENGTLLMEEGEKKYRDFEIQHVSGVDLEGMARNLSALIHEQGISSKIPESITFFDMYGIEHPQELNVAERWRKNESHKSLAVPLGVRATDDYVELNLHEKAHGPHGLVAGTTGSGKSEIVQSYILSLAVNFHPHEVGFLLIDYKGGGMANLFARGNYHREPLMSLEFMKKAYNEFSLLPNEKRRFIDSKSELHFLECVVQGKNPTELDKTSEEIIQNGYVHMYVHTLLKRAAVRICNGELDIAQNLLNRILSIIDLEQFTRTKMLFCNLMSSIYFLQGDKKRWKNILISKINFHKRLVQVIVMIEK